MLAQHFRVEFNRGILLKNVTEIQEKLGRNLPIPEEKKGARFVLTPLMAVIELRCVQSSIATIDCCETH